MLSNEVFSSYFSPVGLFMRRFFAWPIFCLTHLILKTGQTGSAQRPWKALRAFQLTSLQVCGSQKLFSTLILMVWRAVLWGWPATSAPSHLPPPPPIPTRTHRSGRETPVQPKNPPIVAPRNRCPLTKPNTCRLLESNSPDVSR